MTASLSEPERYQVPVYRFESDPGPATPQRATGDEDEAISVRLEERQYGAPELYVIYDDHGDQHRYRLRVVDEARRWCRPLEGTPMEHPVAVRHAVSAYGFALVRESPAYHWLFALQETIATWEALRDTMAEFEPYPVVSKAFRDALGAIEVLIDLIRARARLPEATYRGVVDRVDPPTPDEMQAGIDALRSALATAVEETVQSPSLDLDELHDAIDTETVSTADGQFRFVELINELDAYRFEFRLLGDDRCVLERPDAIAVPPSVAESVQSAGFTVDNITTVTQATRPLGVAEHAAVFTRELVDASLLGGRWSGAAMNPVRVAAANTRLLALALKLFDLDAAYADEIYRRVCDSHDIQSVEELDHDTYDRLMKAIMAQLPREINEDLLAYKDTHPSQKAP